MPGLVAGHFFVVLVLYAELCHLIPFGLAWDQGIDDGRGFQQQGWEQFLRVLEVLGVHVWLCSVVLECLDEDVFVGVILVAVPVEEDVALFSAGGLGEFVDLLAEVFCVLGLWAEANVNQNHMTNRTGLPRILPLTANLQ